jgi:hypothetical protein
MNKLHCDCDFFVRGCCLLTTVLAPLVIMSHMIIGGVMKPPNIEPTRFAAHAQNSKKVCVVPPSVIPYTTTASSGDRVAVNVVTPPLSTAACTQQILLGELSSKRRVTSTLPSSRDSIDVSSLPSSIVPPTTTASSGDHVAVNVVTPPLSTS